jgi:serine protease Do
VVTNHHVIAGQRQIQVTVHGGKSYPAHLIGEDPLLDIAVLKIDAEGPFVALKLGDSSKVKVGQWVMAVGNPFGLGETVTQGIISARERSLSDNQRDLFQTDAAINPGNSGGPLVNLHGEIIGINVAIFSPDRQNPGYQGVGFSIPSNDVKEALRQILERGRPTRGFLGVQMQDLDAKTKSGQQYDGAVGALVLGVVPGSPAQFAGLLGGDVILLFGEKEIRSKLGLFSLVQSARVGEQVAIEVWRAGQRLSLKATIQEAGEQAVVVEQGEATVPDNAEVKNHDIEAVVSQMGVEVRDLSVQERMMGVRGVVVTKVSESGLAAQDLRVGDMVVGVNRRKVTGASEFFMHLAHAVVKKETVLHLVRDGKVLGARLPVLPRTD